MISTTQGPMNEEDLDIYVTEEEVPCGKSEETTYVEKTTGKIVRKDVKIYATKPFIVTGKVSLFNKVKSWLLGL